MNSYKLTIISLLASIAIVGRFAFSIIPNVQPVTTIIIIGGIILGPIPAIILAILITYLSNLFLGMGIWTIGQIIAWSSIGLLSGLLGKLKLKLSTLVLFSILTGYLYGFIISLTTYTVAGKFLPYYLAGLPFDTYHALGNGLFMAILYPTVSMLLYKYKNKYLD